jgi:hypothetical protein
MNTVLVIRPIHNAQRQAYEYKPIEVPAETAEDQLTKKDEQRNAAWRGVRYATDEEHNAYFKTAPKVKIEKAPESEEETEVNTLADTSNEPAKNKPGRKPKVQA